jgi:hypothetical protein
MRRITAKRLILIVILVVQSAMSSSMAFSVPPIRSSQAINWGMSLYSLNAALNLKIKAQRAPAEYDGGATLIYGLRATLQFEIGKVDGLRGIILRIHAPNNLQCLEQFNELHGHMEADLGKPIVDRQDVNSNNCTPADGAEWLWSDGSVLLLAQPGNQILLSYRETLPSHETLLLTKQILNSIPLGTARRFQWPLNGGIFVIHRTQEQIRGLADNTLLEDPHSIAPPSKFLSLESHGSTPLATGKFIHYDRRSIIAEYGVYRDTAPLEGCSLKFVSTSSSKQAEMDAIAQLGKHWYGGFYDVCRHVAFDTAGRAYKNAVAMPNMMIPEYSFSNDGSLVIGDKLSK